MMVCLLVHCCVRTTFALLLFDPFLSVFPALSCFLLPLCVVHCGKLFLSPLQFSYHLNALLHPFLSSLPYREILKHLCEVGVRLMQDA